MNDMTKTALIGTARAANDALATGTAIDALIDGLGEMDRERALLLRAGAFSIYTEAGMLPTQRAEPLPAPAPTETLTQCSPGAAAVLQVLLKQRQELLPEALDRMIAHARRLPPELLPLVLGGRLSAELRPALRRVIGERGYWLAQFNSAWQWATEAPIVGADLPDDAETIWQEGLPSQRLDIFTRLRQRDPAQAREWLAAAWRREKAEMRADLLSALAVNLSLADEALLEAGLDDKVERVRSAAVVVLAALPGSAFAARMTARADAMLIGYTPGALHLSERIAWADDFARDGIVKEPPSGTAKSDWYLRQVLSFVAPAHWQQRFGATPAALTAAALGNPYEQSLFEGWSRGAVNHPSTAWLADLWDWWAQPDRARLVQHHLRDDLLARMPQEDAEMRLLRVIDDGHDYWGQLIGSLPKPWSAQFSRDYLTRLQEYVVNLAPDAVSFDGNWPQSFSAAAHGMPPAFLTQLPDELATPWTQVTNWQYSQWNNAWRDLREVATLRLRIHSEIGSLVNHSTQQ